MSIDAEFSLEEAEMYGPWALEVARRVLGAASDPRAAGLAGSLLRLAVLEESVLEAVLDPGSYPEPVVSPDGVFRGVIIRRCDCGDCQTLRLVGDRGPRG